MKNIGSRQETRKTSHIIVMAKHNWKIRDPEDSTIEIPTEYRKSRWGQNTRGVRPERNRRTCGIPSTTLKTAETQDSDGYTRNKYEIHRWNSADPSLQMKIRRKRRVIRLTADVLRSQIRTEYRTGPPAPRARAPDRAHVPARMRTGPGGHIIVMAKMNLPKWAC